METAEDGVYRRLQRHLDRQPVGFPATPSKAEIRILKHIFSPEEAAVAACLSHTAEPLETICRRVGDRVASAGALETMLHGMEKKGGIDVRMVDGERRYANTPLVVGMYEMQLGRLTTEFLSDFDAYTSDYRFALSFLSTKLPQMRTIPVNRSIRPEHRIGAFDELHALLAEAEGPFVALPCICRTKTAIQGTPCRVTDRSETCLAIGHVGHSVLQTGSGREIGREEASAILERNQKDGLVLQPSNTERVDFICSCCGCCCGMLRVHRALPRPNDFWVTNFYATIEPSACNGCGACATRCQVGALHVADTATVAVHRCVGCGLCVPTCPKGAIQMIKKQTEIRPPETRDDLYDIIGTHRTGRMGKLALTGKLLIDWLRSGRRGFH